MVNQIDNNLASISIQSLQSQKRAVESSPTEQTRAEAIDRVEIGSTRNEALLYNSSGIIPESQVSSLVLGIPPTNEGDA